MEKVVFTNGCFDILHSGHVDLLERARALGSRLVVGINSDASVRRIKGHARPFVSEADRASVLRGLRAVDEVVIFDESTPQSVIERLNPDVLVKGGDWKIEEIVGADFVIKKGGQVFSLPLKADHSSSKIVDRIKNGKNASDNERATNIAGERRVVVASLAEHAASIDDLMLRDAMAIERCGKIICDVVHGGKKILICGNGGSAADAQHLAAEFVGRFETERRALPAIALTTDTSALTAIANDYGFERIFARQVEALANEGDLLIAISTSGNSANVIAAVMKAREVGCRSLALTGIDGKKLASVVDECILVPSTRTARIQEMHVLIGHIWCELVDERFN